jgi:hypothetical protein
MRVVEGHCESLGLTQHRQDAPKVTQRKERRTQSEMEVDGLLVRATLRWQMLQSWDALCDFSAGLPGAAGLGTLGFTEPVAREMVTRAGFASLRRRDFNNPLNSFFEVRLYPKGTEF